MHVVRRELTELLDVALGDEHGELLILPLGHGAQRYGGPTDVSTVQVPVLANPSEGPLHDGSGSYLKWRNSSRSGGRRRALRAQILGESPLA